MTNSVRVGDLRVDMLPAPQDSSSALALYGRIRELITPVGEQAPPAILVASPPESLSELAERVRRAAQTDRGREALETAALIVQTSGSTSGTPSLVALSSLALVSGAQATYARLGSPGTWVVALPLQHIAGLQMLVRAAVAGREPRFPEGWPTFCPDTFARAVAEATQDSDEAAPGVPTYASLVSAQLDAILRSGPSVVADVARLDSLLLGGGRIPQSLLDRARAAGINVCTTYGMTETSGGCVYNGVALPNTKIRMEPETDRVLIASGALMNGYLDEDTPWVEIDKTRYFRTSDTGYLSEQGILQIQGRADEVIKSGGVKISAAEISEVLAQMASVDTAFCVGLPDEVWGEVLAAVVVPSQEGTARTVSEVAEEVRAHVRNEVGPKYVPRVVVLADRLPVTAIGKVSRASAKVVIHEAIRSGTAWRR